MRRVARDLSFAVKGAASLVNRQFLHAFQAVAAAVQPPLRVLFHAHTSNGLSLIAHVEGNVSFLFLEGACIDFSSLGWAVSLPIATGRLAGVGHVDMWTVQG